MPKGTSSNVYNVRMYIVYIVYIVYTVYIMMIVWVMYILWCEVWCIGQSAVRGVCL